MTGVAGCSDHKCYWPETGPETSFPEQNKLRTHCHSIKPIGVMYQRGNVGGGSKTTKNTVTECFGMRNAAHKKECENPGNQGVQTCKLSRGATIEWECGQIAACLTAGLCSRQASTRRAGRGRRPLPWLPWLPWQRKKAALWDASAQVIKKLKVQYVMPYMQAILPSHMGAARMHPL